MQNDRLPTYFISHGGGPWPYMPELRAKLQILEASLADLPRQIGRTPRAILMISGHWVAPQLNIMGNAQPPMVYDYYGFPDYTYTVKYNAPGAPAVAQRIRQLLEAASLPSVIDTEQGFDHGSYTPAVAMYPKADVPMLQLSLQASFDPALHIAVGRALMPLRDEGVLIVGSGLSYHNLRNFGPAAKEASKRFDDWLRHILALPTAERHTELLQWEQAPAARQAHPQEDHLIPLMVALGAAENEPTTLIYHEENLFGGVTASSFRFGEGAAPTAAGFG